MNLSTTAIGVIYLVSSFFMAMCGLFIYLDHRQKRRYELRRLQLKAKQQPPHPPTLQIHSMPRMPVSVPKQSPPRPPAVTWLPLKIDASDNPELNDYRRRLGLLIEAASDAREYIERAGAFYCQHHPNDHEARQRIERLADVIDQVVDDWRA
jgi:hypothetical protein